MIQNSKLKIKNLKAGFTLIELLVVISVIGILVVTGFIYFSSYSRKQTLDQAASNLRSVVEKARSNAIARVIPSGNQSCTPSFSYSISINCQNPTNYSLLICSDSLVAKYTLPRNISLVGYNCSLLSFYASTNLLACGTGDIPAYIAIKDDTDSIRLISIDNVGNVAISSPTKSSLQAIKSWISCP